MSAVAVRKEVHCLPRISFPQWITSPRRQSPRFRRGKGGEKAVAPADQEMGQAFSFNPTEGSAGSGTAATNSFTGANLISNTTTDSTHGRAGEDRWGDHLYSCECEPPSANQSAPPASHSLPLGETQWQKRFCGSGGFKTEPIYAPSSESAKKLIMESPRASLHNGGSFGSPFCGSEAALLEEPEFLELDRGTGLHWAHGAAGEDRFQVVISGEHNWSLIGIYDGFSGHTAADYLTKSLFKRITARLRSYLSDGRGPPIGEAGSLSLSSSSPPPMATASPMPVHLGAISESYGSSKMLGDKGEVGGGDGGEEDGQQEGDVKGEDDKVRWVLREMELALLDVEEEFTEKVEEQPERMAELAFIGSCVLVVLHKGDDLFTMNVGDSRALLASAPPPGTRVPHPGQKHWPLVDVLGSEEDHLFDNATQWPAGWRPEENIKEVNFHGLFNRVEWATNETSTAVGRSDSFRLLLSEGTGVLPSVLTTIQLTVDHLLSEPRERDRLVAEHPDDDHVIEKERVKGKLKVTRAFGAGFLKKPSWNARLLGMFRVKYVGNAPYVVPTPTLRYRKLSSRDRFLLLSSDGLFQFFTNEQAVEYVQYLIIAKPHEQPARGLAMEVLRRAAKSAGIGIDELNEIPHGERRRFHDDITILVLPLLSLQDQRTD